MKEIIKQDKKKLYENIMASSTKEVKKVLNDHSMIINNQRILEIG